MSKKPFVLTTQSRITIILLFFLLAFAALLGRLFILQIVYHREYVRLASRQHRLVKEILPERGVIYAQDKQGTLIPLALNRIQKTLVASPKDIKNPQEVSKILVQELHLKPDEVMKKLTVAGDPHEIISKNISEENAARLETLQISGLAFEEEKKRVYPYDTVGAHVLGFVSKETEEEAGRYGVERFYEEDLAGRKGIIEGAKDAAGFWVALGRRIVNPPKDGAAVFLSIDYNIQIKAEEVLRRMREKWQALSSLVIVLDPKTGRILAEAAHPVFDPNNFAKEKNFSVFLNPAAESMYELGSVLKPITMAGGLEEKLVGPETTYEDPGAIKFGGFTIRNFDGKSYKTQTMTQVLEKSLNTGAVHVARLLGQERQYYYLKQFGFGEKTGIDLPGEVPGNLSNLKSGRDIDFATASFGQGIAVTPLQLVSAMGAIANGGILMRPHIVEKVTDASGNSVSHQPEARRQVISRYTAETLTKMLVSAVRSGFENRAGIKGYFVAGKTGTAQIPRKDGPGYSDKVIHTFVGYAPAFSPKFLILLQLNEPKGNRFAANTLTPAFHELAEFILNYYEIPPDESSHP